MSKPLRRWTPHEDAVLREHVRRQSPGMLPRGLIDSTIIAELVVPH